MLRKLMENTLDNRNFSENKNKQPNYNISHISLLKKVTNIPKLYQKKKVAFLSKPLKKGQMGNNKEYERYIKIFKDKIKATNYKKIYNKNNTRYYKNNSTNKSNINTINSTSNITNNNTFLNNTNNPKNFIKNNSTFNYMINNIYSSHTFKNKNFQNKINSIKNIKKNINNNESNSDHNDTVNDEYEEEKIPVHTSIYKLKTNRNWGLSRTYAKKDKLVINKDLKKYDSNTFCHKNNYSKFNQLNYDCVKKKLYEGKNDILNNNTNDAKNKNNDVNINKNNKNTSSGNNSNKIKKINFDQPFKNLNFDFFFKNGEHNQINPIPKLHIDLSNFKYNINNQYNTSISHDKFERADKNLENKLFLGNAIENSNKNRYIITEENKNNEQFNKNKLLSQSDIKYNLAHDFYNKNYNTNSYNKLTDIINNGQSERTKKPRQLINSYFIKRHSNFKFFNYPKSIRLKRNNNTCKIQKINFIDFIFDIGNIKFKNYIENYLDDKSIIILSSTNKNFYLNFRFVIYNKYYIKLLLDSDSKKNVREIIKSLLKYSSNGLKKNEIKKIYNSFNYKSFYNENIIKDLTRTFPNDKKFNKNSSGYNKLYNILTAYSNFNKKIGYTQGLNFISAIGLSLFEKEEEVFIFLDGLINRFDLYKYMEINNKNLVESLKYFSNILNKYVPEIISFFEEKLVNHEFFSTNWILTLFSNCMNKAYLIIIWSFMIIFGWKFFYCFTVELLKFYKDDILKMKETELNYKMKHLLNNDKFEKNINLIIKNTLQLMEKCIAL